MGNSNSETTLGLIPLQEFQIAAQKLNQWAQHGCSDGGCQIEQTAGMHTNGGCHCGPRYFADYLLWLACEVDKYGRYKKWEKIQVDLDISTTTKF
jgi:hypothetical protein